MIKREPIAATFSRNTLELLLGLLDAQQITIAHPNAEQMMSEALQAKHELEAALQAKEGHTKQVKKSQ